MVDVPEDQWLQISLMDKWESQDSKLAHRVSPVGPKDREVIDTEFDKMQS